MRLIICLVTMLLCWINSSSQISNDYGEMLKEAEKILFTEPQESIKIAEHVAQKSDVENQMIQAYLTTSLANYINGNYDKAVKSILEAKIRSEATNNVEMLSKTSVYSIYILYHLGLNVVAEEYLVNLNKLSEVTNYKDNPWIKVGQSLITGFNEAEMNNYEKASQQFSNAEDLLKQIQDKAFLPLIQVSRYELKLNQIKPSDALIYFNTLLKADSTNDFHNLVLNIHLGEVNFLSKNYPKSIEHYQKALLIAKKFENNYYLAEIVDALASSYLAMDDKEQFQINKKSAILLSNASELDEDQAVNSIYNYININHTNRRDAVQKSYQTNIWILSGLIFLVVISFIALKWRYQARANQYKEFINFFEKRQQTAEEPKKEVAKNSTIPKETEDILLHQLKQFEKSKQFTKQDMSLAQLASSFDTNTKYLSEVINTYKEKNFNAYINDLRINYIIDKLQNNSTYLQYKISYLAEESGFSSHSSFATVFKSVTGISPTVFIEILESQIKKSKSSRKIYEVVE